MYGLLGYPLGHSFSKGWYEAKGYEFRNFEFEDAKQFWQQIPDELEGFCVTIPHKQNVIELLDEIDEAAQEIGAVNCVVVEKESGRKRGYNTDVIGFWDALSPVLNAEKLASGSMQAAVLGSGGASKAAVWALQKRGIKTQIISRQNGGYETFEPQNFDIIVNSTPLGMFPKVDAAPPIDYSKIKSSTVCYDLVYNPSDTLFLKKSRQNGAVVLGGIKMLHLQAEAALRLFSTQS